MGVSDGARAATDVPEGGEGWSRDVREAKRSRQFSNPRRVLTNHLAKTALIVVPLGAAVVSEPVPTSIRRPRLRAPHASRARLAPAAPPRRASPPLFSRARFVRRAASRRPRGSSARVSVPFQSHHISDTPARDGSVVRPGPPRAGAMSNPDSVILEEEIDENYEPSQEGASEPGRRGGARARRRGPGRDSVQRPSPPRDSRPPPPHFFPETATPTASSRRNPPPPRVDSPLALPAATPLRPLPPFARAPPSHRAVSLRRPFLPGGLRRDRGCAKWLGLDLEAEKDLLWIAREGLKAAPPGTRKPCKTPGTGDIYYFNFQTGDSVWGAQCDEYYKSLYAKEKANLEERRRKEKTAAARNPPDEDASAALPAPSAANPTPTPNPLNKPALRLGSLTGLAPLGTAASGAPRRRPPPLVSALVARRVGRPSPGRGGRARAPRRGALRRVPPRRTTLGAMRRRRRTRSGARGVRGGAREGARAWEREMSLEADAAKARASRARRSAGARDGGYAPRAQARTRDARRRCARSSRRRRLG